MTIWLGFEPMSGMAFSPSDEGMGSGKGIVSCSRRQRSRRSLRGTDAPRRLRSPVDLSRRAKSDQSAVNFDWSVRLNPIINQGCGCGRYSLSRRALSLGGIAMPFVSLMRHPFIRIAVVTVSAIAAVPALAQSAAQWPERPV